MHTIAPPEGHHPPVDLALLPPEFIVNPGPEYADDQRQFQGIPGVEQAVGGRIWAAWYSGGVWEGWRNYVILTSSADDGKSWSPFRMVIKAAEPVRVFDPCLWLDPLGRLWIFWSQSMASQEEEGLFFDGRFGVWATWTEQADEEVPIWSAPRRIGDGIMMNKPTVGKDGSWYLPVSIWEQDAKLKGAPPPWRHWMGEQSGAYAVISTDLGQTFEYRGKADTQLLRGFDEHMFMEREDGSLWMLSRVRNGIWENLSDDSGKTWTTGSFSSIPHEDARFFIRRLASGSILLVRHAAPDNQEKKRSHLTAFLSRDDGRNWEGGLLLDERSRVSYPDGFQSKDGRIFVIYDYNRSTDKQILLSAFREEDVIAGKWQSADAFNQRLVNQATGPCGTDFR